ncbi:MAG: outer membrane protein assembly factor BamB [Gammaproteobacteria bacterium]|nr:outer membrane protein assembly factor BamB [Gammaproteobacteria bacterium]
MIGRGLALIGAAVLISGCSVFGKDDEELEPVELVDFDETLDIRRLWSEKIGGGSEFLRVGLNPAGDGDRVYAASYNGNVVALNVEDGKRIWRTELDIVLSAGPGVGGGYVIVAGYDGELVALNAADGAEAWRVDIQGESLSRPIVSGNTVIVYTIDGRLGAYSVFDGRELWLVEQNLPALTQRGTASPIAVGNAIIAGFDNGRLLAIDIDDGVVQWEAVLTPPSGRTDLDRLADVDGTLAAVGRDVYASSYNGRIAALAVESGQVLWAREISSPTGVAADWNNVYTVGNQGEVIAILRRNGDDVWRQESLLRREPTSPTPFGTAIVVGDFEGYVHFFSNFDGHPVARERVGSGMISGPPVVLGDKLIVQSESGTVAAFAVRLPKRAPGSEEES